MKQEIQPAEQDYDLPGQMAFFPEYETEDPAPHIRLQNPIALPVLSQLEQWQLSILMSDVLLRFEGELPEAWLFDIMVGHGYLSNFVYQDALGAMIDGGTAVRAKEDGEEILRLTASGRRNAKRLRLMVPKIFRDQVHLTALRHCSRQRALRDLKISCEPDGNEWRLCLHCMDRQREMFFLRISSPTRENAEELSERILRNPVGFFGRIIDLAMTNEEESFDLTDN